MPASTALITPSRSKKVEPFASSIYAHEAWVIRERFTDLQF
jgi:hypothetical protein